MTAQLIDGKRISQEIQNEVAQKVAERKQANQIIPGLAVVLVGSDPASQIYVNSKQKSCEKIGFYSEKIELGADTPEDKLLAIIDELNFSLKIHGILVQLPLPAHINTQKVIERISPYKDVDGFHAYNLGHLAQANPILRPCTPFGCMRLIESTKETLTGKDAVIVGASNIVGRPMALELLMANTTVTICHSKTKNLPGKIKQAEVLVVAVGKPEMVKGDWIKPGAIVIDVGINRMPDGKIKGDVEFETAKERAAWITPVPGGVGPMTIAMLMTNTLCAVEFIEKQGDAAQPFTCGVKKN